MDTFDQNAMEFRPRHRCRRWYVSIFWALFGFVVLNSWIIRKNIQQQNGITKAKCQSQKEFIQVKSLFVIFIFIF